MVLVTEKINEALYFWEKTIKPMSNELLLFKPLPWVWQKNREVFLKRLQGQTELTKKASLWLSQEEFEAILIQDPEIISIWKHQGLARLYLEIPVQIEDYVYSGVVETAPEILSLVKKLQQFAKKCDFIKIIPCLKAEEDHIHHLAPLLARLYKKSFDNFILVPPEKRTKGAVEKYRDLFLYLRMRDVSGVWIHFDPFDKKSPVWNAQSYNAYNGPTVVHIDLSNRCTHSCIFCGLYSPDSIEKTKDPQTGKLYKSTTEFMGLILDTEQGLKSLHDLPESVQSIQFGGVGDPMLHPRFFDFIKTARERGIFVEILSNMEYLTPEMIRDLTPLGGTEILSLHFIANISGASEEMYLKTRPRQKAHHYEKVMNNLKMIKAEREANNGTGISFTMMCVLNNVNYVEAEAYVELSKSVGASRVYLKPLEVHCETQVKLLPRGEDKALYTQHMKRAVNKAKKLDLPIVDQASIEQAFWGE